MINRVHSLYVLLSLTAAALSFYKLFYLASVLTSESFGMYSFVIISYVYIGYIGTFGANEYMLKSGSCIHSNDSEIFKIRNNALFYGFCGIFFLSIFIFFLNLTFFNLNKSDSFILYAIIALALVTLPYNIFESYYRSQQKLLIFSAMLLFKSFLVTTSILIVSKEYGFFGAIISEITAVFIIVFFVFIKEHKRIFFSAVDKPLIACKKIIDNGFFICMSNLLRNLALSADRYVVVFIFGLYYFGVYSFIMIFFQGVVLFSGMIINVFGPKVISMHSNNQSVDSLFIYFIKILSLIFVISLVLYPIAVYITPLFFEYFFEQYANDKIYTYMKIVYWLSVFSFLIFIFDWFYIALSKEWFISLISFLSLSVVGLIFLSCFFIDLSFDSYLLLLLFSKLFCVTAMLVNAYVLKCGFFNSKSI